MSNEQDATPSEKAFRFLALLIFNKQSYSLTELSGLLSMSKAAVSRMIRNFENSGVGFLSREQRGREIYVKLERVPKSSNIALNADGLKELALCRDFLAALLPEDLRDNTLSTLCLANSFVAPSQELPPPIPAAPLYKGKINNTLRQHELETLICAIENKLVCKITYKGASSKEARTWFLAPKRLLAYHEAIYIDGWKVTPDLEPQRVYPDPMRLPLQRFMACQLTEASSSLLPDTPLNSESFGLMEIDEFELKVRFRGASAVYVSERVWSAEQQLEAEGEDAIILTFKASNEQETIAWILGFGEDAQILAPDWLIKDFRRALRGMLKLYKKAGLNEEGNLED